MSYKVGTLSNPIDTSNVEQSNAAFKPVVDAINNCGLLDFQATVHIVDRQYWLDYYKFKGYPNKGLRIVQSKDNFSFNANYYLEIFDWTDDLDIYDGVPNPQNMKQIFYYGPNAFNNISWLYEENSALQIYQLSVFYTKSPDNDSKQLLVATYCSDTRWITHADTYREFLNNLGTPSYMIPYRNSQGENNIIAVAYLSFANQYYTDKIYAGSRDQYYTLVPGQKYRMTDIETSRSETIYYMYPHFFREG